MIKSNSISTEQAYELLNLPLGADKDAIIKSYKKLAQKWHPEKQAMSSNAQDALSKFKSINIAYKKLMNYEREKRDMSIHEMFEQYRQVMHINLKNKRTTSTSTSSDLLENQKKLTKLKNTQDDETNTYDIKQKAREYGLKGNSLAVDENYEEAIKKFSEAISLDSSDCRFYGNRSYCYDKLGLFEEALKDAEKAIEIEPTWPKGYFRQGRALAGLKNYTEAESAYEKMFEFESVTDMSELNEELYKVRTMQLQEMGFSKLQSELAIKNYKKVQLALEAILLHHSSDTENAETNNNDFKYENRNHSSLGESSLWVGNVDPKVSEKRLQEMFAEFGQVSTVRCLTDKYCAFVNYKHKEDAQKAINELQGKLVEGLRLLIKFPENSATATIAVLSSNAQKATLTNVPKKSLLTETTNTFLNNINSKKAKIETTCAPKKQKNLDSNDLKSSANIGSSCSSSTSGGSSTSTHCTKITGPVNGNECYFWRTTGCVYADKCRYKHVAKNKGIDKKPWHKAI